MNRWPACGMSKPRPTKGRWVSWAKKSRKWKEECRRLKTQSTNLATKRSTGRKGSSKLSLLLNNLSTGLKGSSWVILSNLPNHVNTASTRSNKASRFRPLGQVPKKIQWVFPTKRIRNPTESRENQMKNTKLTPLKYWLRTPANWTLKQKEF